MNLADRDSHLTLARHHAWPAISIYLPIHRSGSEKQQDRLRLKNLLRSASEKLANGGMRGTDADAFCAPVTAVLDDDTFWREGSEGLAVFVADDRARVVRLGRPVPEQLVVGDRFYLRPLLAADRGDRRFFALALDRGGCRLFRGDGESVEQLPLDGAPASLAEELQYDETQQSIQYSSLPAPQSAAQGGRPTGAVFHGHGGEKDTDKVNLERYLRKVEGAVAKSVACEASIPLVLLGVDYELAIYRALNTCPSLVAEQVNGATDELTPLTVSTRALSALDAHFAAGIEAQLAELAEREGSELVNRNATQIVIAAAAGRVKTLFFDDATGPFGTFDREAQIVDAVCAETPRLLREGGAVDGGPINGECGWDLVDLAAAETVLHGGDVHAFTGEDPPVRGVAALLRY